MAQLDGANVILGLKKATTWGTATAIGANDKLEVDNLSVSENTQELTATPIGSGDSMYNESQRGFAAPTASFTKKLNFAGADFVALAQMMGSASVAGPGTGGYYNHSILFSELANQTYVTTALLATTASVMELQTGVVTKATIAAVEPPNYVTMAVDLLAQSMTFQSATNTPATIATATVQDTERVVVQPQSTFRINAMSAAALGAGDQRAITGATLELTRPQELPREIKGSAGLGTPATSGEVPFMGTLTVTFRNLADVNDFLDHQSGKEFKCSFQVTSAASANKYVEFNIPRMKIVASPAWDVGSAGNNPYTVVFKLLIAASYPTGMIDWYPYFRIANSRSSSFLA